MEQETRDVAEAIHAADGKLAGVRSDWQAQLGSEAADKLERLIKRDQELTERLGAFPAQQEAIQEEVLQREGNIFRLLERMSRAISAKDSLPDRQRMRELEQELRYKEMQLGAAKARRESPECALRRPSLCYSAGLSRLRHGWPTRCGHRLTD